MHFKIPIYRPFVYFVSLNPTCSGLFREAREVGGGGAIWPPNYFRGSHAKSAIFVRYSQNNPKNKLTDQISSL